MVIGFIFIKTHSKEEVKTYRLLREIPEIIEINPLFGDYDIIAKVEAKDFKDLSMIVLNKIRKIPGVVDTMTMPGIKI
ncbi:MAG: Lrp/AsnC ligand binding domain-containing protein [Thermoplasmatota archaeon]